MALVSFVYQDGSGNAIASPTVNVYDAGTTTPRLIYSDEALTIPITQPWTAPTNGKVEFFTAGGLIRLVVSKTGFTTYDRDNIEVVDRSDHPAWVSGKVTYGTTAVIDDNTKRVGIGTLTPGKDLEVTNELEVTSAEDSNLATVYLENASGQVWRLQLTAAGPLTLSDLTAGNQVFALDNGAANNFLRVKGSRLGIGTATPNAAAVVDIVSTAGFFCLPSMTTTQRDAIASPPDRAVFYNSTLGKVQARAGGAWVNLH